jgi:hypothetical protein
MPVAQRILISSESAALDTIKAAQARTAASSFLITNASLCLENHAAYQSSSQPRTIRPLMAAEGDDAGLFLSIAEMLADVRF